MKTLQYLIHEYQNSDIGTQMLKKTRTAVDEFGGYGDDEDDGERFVLPYSFLKFLSLKFQPLQLHLRHPVWDPAQAITENNVPWSTAASC